MAFLWCVLPTTPFGRRLSTYQIYFGIVAAAKRTPDSYNADIGLHVGVVLKIPFTSGDEHPTSFVSAQISTFIDTGV